MNTALREGETLIKQGMANMLRGIEAVGGKLYLTDQRLIFESHAFNVQTGASEFALADLASCTAGRTKLLGLIPMVPNAIDVQPRQGKAASFTLYGRHEWVAAIGAQIAAIHS